MCTDDDMLAVR